MGTSTFCRGACAFLSALAISIGAAPPLWADVPDLIVYTGAGLDEAAIAEVFVRNEAALVGCEERHATTADSGGSGKSHGAGPSQDRRSRSC